VFVQRDYINFSYPFQQANSSLFSLSAMHVPTTLNNSCETFRVPWKCCYNSNEKRYVTRKRKTKTRQSQTASHRINQSIHIIPSAKMIIFLLPLHQSSREPIESLIQAISGCRTAGLNVPLTVGWTKTVKTKLVRHFCCTHGIGEILFVGKD
jgi:hypothetical protein